VLASHLGDWIVIKAYFIFIHEIFAVLLYHAHKHIFFINFWCPWFFLVSTMSCRVYFHCPSSFILGKFYLYDRITSSFWCLSIVTVARSNLWNFVCCWCRRLYLITGLTNEDRTCLHQQISAVRARFVLFPSFSSSLEQDCAPLFQSTIVFSTWCFRHSHLYCWLQLVCWWDSFFFFSSTQIFCLCRCLTVPLADRHTSLAYVFLQESLHLFCALIVCLIGFLLT